MPIVSLDCLSFSGLSRTFKLPPNTHKKISTWHAMLFTSTLQRPAYGLVGWWRLNILKIQKAMKTFTSAINKTQPFYFFNMTHDLISETQNKKVWNSMSYFICTHIKHYSEMCCITDNTTYFSYQNVNISFTSHKSNYDATWQTEHKVT
jgi:hypothetical protein